jgi:hypothetical protein
MPRIRSSELLTRISQNNFSAIKLRGLQDGSFCLLLETSDSSLILENDDGSMKEYPKADNALTWLKRMTHLKEVMVDIEIWRSDKQ